MADETASVPVTRKDSMDGILFSVGAFLIWGFAPVFWKALGRTPATETLAHRIVWGLVLLTVILTVRSSWKAFFAIFKNPRVLGMMFLAASLLLTNWFTFIYAMITNRVLDTSLGYFINPLISVLLGFLLLAERLRPAQTLAVVLAGAGVAYMTLAAGTLPWISLVLAFSFGFYGLVRKIVQVEALPGLAFECAIFSAPALAYIFYLGDQGTGSFMQKGFGHDLLLFGTGVITAVPLLLFNLGVRRIRLSTMGFLQYIAPTCSFLLGVFAYKEPFTFERLVAFIGIWLALMVYTVDGLRASRRSRRVYAAHRPAPGGEP